MPSFSEILVILVLGVLLFGRRLPEVGRTVGRTLFELRHAWEKMRREMDQDPELREVTHSVREIHNSVQRTQNLVADPNRVWRNLGEGEGRGAAPAAVPPPAAAPAAVSPTPAAPAPVAPTPAAPAPVAPTPGASQATPTAPTPEVTPTPKVTLTPEPAAQQPDPN